MILHLASTCFPNCHATTSTGAPISNTGGGSAALGFAVVLIGVRLFLAKKGTKGGGK